MARAHNKFEFPFEEEPEPEVMLLAFINVTASEPWLIKDNYGLAYNILLPSFKKLNKIPKIDQKDHADAEILYKSLVLLYKDLNNVTIPH